MRSIDRLEKNRRMKQQRRPPELPDEMEEEMSRPPLEALDRAKSVFDFGQDKRWGGINTAPSVFDRQAIFKTKK